MCVCVELVFLPCGLDCVRLFLDYLGFLDCLGCIPCFLSFATVDLVVVSDGHRTVRFRYGEPSVAES